MWVYLEEFITTTYLKPWITFFKTNTNINFNNLYNDFINTILSKFIIFDIFNYSFFFIFFFIFIFYFYYFIYSSSFLRLILSICFIILCSTLLSYFELDFYGAFLLSAELPLFLVAFLFFFHKTSLSFNNIYEIENTKKTNIFVVLTTVFIFYFLDTMLFDFQISIFNFQLNTLLQVMYTNDFFIYYNVYYSLYPVFVINLAILIFIVSFLVIHLFYNLKLNINLKYKKTQNLSFLRKQNLMRQAIHKSQLSFFKKK